MSFCLWFIGKYNKWDKVDPAELFSQAPTEKKEANPKLNMVKFLQVCGAGGAQAGKEALPLTPFPSPPPQQGGISPQPLGRPHHPFCECPKLAH